MNESDIQIAVWQHLQRRAVPGLVGFHPANGGKRSIQWATKLQRMGVVPGVSDLIFQPRYALELKTESGRLTEAQEAFLEAVEASGGKADVAYGLNDALKKLRAWDL